MKGIILLNGEPYSGEIKRDGAIVYCCDGAYEWAKAKVKIDKNLGDFDSLGYVPDPPSCTKKRVSWGFSSFFPKERY